MLDNVILCGYKVPTPIQAYCLPSVLKGIDIIGIAQTGTVLFDMKQPMLILSQDLGRQLRS